MHKLISVGVFGLRALLCIVALGLSATFVSNYKIGSAPTTLRYATFTGGFGLITCAIGILSLYLEMIPMLVVAGLEAISGLTLLGGGIAFAIGLKGTSCTYTTQDQFDTLTNIDLINQGKITVEGQTAYGYQIGANSGEEAVARLQDNCRRAVADQAFQFLAFGFALGTLFLCWMYLRNGRPGKASYV